MTSTCGVMGERLRRGAEENKTSNSCSTVSPSTGYHVRSWVGLHSGTYVVEQSSEEAFIILLCESCVSSLRPSCEVSPDLSPGRS
jgi:hypothetical protein